jgi:tRNA pseudouridine38-40 synthase
VYHRYFFRLAYNGTTFSGWQSQPNTPTVQDAIEKTLSGMLHEKVSVIGCGRTDTGVHASRYYAHIDAQRDDLATDDQFLFRLNKSLPGSIAVNRIYRMPENAHARFSARSRSYEYHILKAKNALTPDLGWFMHDIPDVSRMNAAAAQLKAHDDFIAFSKTGNTMSTTICRISEAVWKEDDDKIVFHISSNRFLRNMVRAIVGALVEIGKGNQKVEWINEILVSKQQSFALAPVPPNGLFLSDVVYPPEFGLDI